MRLEDMVTKQIMSLPHPSEIVEIGIIKNFEDGRIKSLDVFIILKDDFESRESCGPKDIRYYYGGVYIPISLHYVPYADNAIHNTDVETLGLYVKYLAKGIVIYKKDENGY